MVFNGLRRYFRDTIWVKQIETLPLARRICIRACRITYLVIKGFTDERLNQQAAALTYVSFLSIIPLIAVALSLGKAFGFEKTVVPLVRKIMSTIDVEIQDQIINVVDETNLAALGAVGGLVLLWTILKTLLNLESSFNQIWSVNNNRPLWRASAYYLSVVIIVPLLVGASTTLMAYLNTEGEKNWFESLPGMVTLLNSLERIVPFVITWLAFSLLFAFMVNTRVHPFAAVSSAFVATLLWSLLQWAYITTQVMVSKQLVYGAFAFLPIFMVYLYLCWLITLFGSRIGFALQNENSFRRDRIARSAGMRYRAAAGLIVLNSVADAFAKGKRIDRVATIAEKHDLPLPLVQELLKLLVQAGILHDVSQGDEEGGIESIVPTRSLDQIAIREVLMALEGGDGTVRMPKRAVRGKLKDILDKTRIALDEALEGITVQDMVE
jgi:membrane protein